MSTFSHSPSLAAAGEQRALRERMQAAIEVEQIDNSSSPFCLFCGKDSSGACGR